ncbi:MAG: hypothetical protein JSW27_00970 [Phycisphaerales bacterium]|nr:MAG: hypothetical protein JSW27_00970 [Phycisphaerales bacterium]
MNGQPLKVSLPGAAYQRGQRWWWRVKLPGEDKPRARALKPEGQKAATKDLQTAAKVAFKLWERAVEEEAQRRVRIDADEKISRLKAKFLQKMHDVSQLVNGLADKEGTGVQERVDGNVLAAGSSYETEETGICDCCGTRDVPVTSLQAIDSGQSLCPDCLTALREAAGSNAPHEAEHTR